MFWLRLAKRKLNASKDYEDIPKIGTFKQQEKHEAGQEDERERHTCKTKPNR